MLAHQGDRVTLSSVDTCAMNAEVTKAILKYLADTQGASAKGIRRYLKRRFPLPDIPTDMGLALKPLVEQRTIFEMRGVYCIPADAPAVADRMRGIKPQAKERRWPAVRPSIRWVDANGEVTMLTHNQAKMRRAAGLSNHATPPTGRTLDPTKFAKRKKSPGKTGESTPKPPERPLDIKSLHLPKHDWLRDD